MKKIGLLGGTSWTATIKYYEYLSRKAQSKLGGLNTANLVLHNPNYNSIRSRYTSLSGWDEIPDLLLRELNELNKAEPSCIVVCNDMFHMSIDVLKSENKLSTLPPIIHMVEIVGKNLMVRNKQKFLMPNTRFTEECGSLSYQLKNKFNISVDVPRDIKNRSHRATDHLQTLPVDRSSGWTQAEFKGVNKEMLAVYPEYDGIMPVNATTSLVISKDGNDVELLDPIKLQCNAALEFVFDG